MSGEERGKNVSEVSARRVTVPLRDSGTALSGFEILEAIKAMVGSGRMEFLEMMQKIGVYAFRNPHETAFATIHSIVGATGTGPSSVHRFAKSLGFSDYSGCGKFSKDTSPRLPTESSRVLLRH